jgi:ABC-type multidrug transport system ATPase subunit
VELYDRNLTYPQRLPVNPVVKLDRVTVRYGRQQALRDVTASFPSGAVGLLGPNGAR